MGRKVGTLYINPKKFGNTTKPCMKEMITFLNCLSLNQMNDEKCSRHKELLSTCMDAQTNKKRKPWEALTTTFRGLVGEGSSLDSGKKHV